MVIDRNRIGRTGGHLGRKLDGIDLIGGIGAIDMNDIVAAAQVSRFDINQGRRVGVITEGQAVDTVAQINHKIVGGVAPGDIVGLVGPHQTNLCWFAFGVEPPAVDRSVIIRIPRDREAAIIKGGYRGLILAAGNLLINQEVRRRHGAVIAIDLAADIPAAAIPMAAAVLPGDDKAAILETNSRRCLLARTYIIIDPELTDRLGTVGIHDPCPDIAAAAGNIIIAVAGARVIAPGDDKAAVRQGGNRRLILVPGQRILVNPELADRLRAIGLKDARPDILTVTGDVVVLMVRAAFVTPGDDKIAVSERGNGWLGLVPGHGLGID